MGECEKHTALWLVLAVIAVDTCNASSAVVNPGLQNTLARSALCDLKQPMIYGGSHGSKMWAFNKLANCEVFMFHRKLLS